jgi:hypothetical protein
MDTVPCQFRSLLSPFCGVPGSHQTQTHHTIHSITTHSSMQANMPLHSSQACKGKLAHTLLAGSWSSRKHLLGA